mgnify:CR=1 FL=1
MNCKRNRAKYIHSCLLQRIVSHRKGSQIRFMSPEYQENDENIEIQTIFDYGKMKQQ